MKKLKHGKVILYAAAIILVCTAALIVSIHVAFGAEESRVTAEENGNIVTVSTTGTAEAGIPSATPGAQFITEEEAVEVFKKTASSVFGVDVTDKTLYARFDDTGTHEVWCINTGELISYIDGISGDVIDCERYRNKFVDDMITLAEFDEKFMTRDNFRKDPDNIYIKAAANIVNASLTDGRSIDYIQIDGVQFVWNNNSEGFDPKAKGHMQVDCHVYMETGNSYILSFWGGFSELQLQIFSTHPTQHACMWGYYYEEDAHVPPSRQDDWQNAPDITDGTYSSEGRN